MIDNHLKENPVLLKMTQSEHIERCKTAAKQINKFKRPDRTAYFEAQYKSEKALLDALPRAD
jgi:hypothetical protein